MFNMLSDLILDGTGSNLLYLYLRVSKPIYIYLLIYIDLLSISRISFSNPWISSFQILIWFMYPFIDSAKWNQSSHCVLALIGYKIDLLLFVLTNRVVPLFSMESNQYSLFLIQNLLKKSLGTQYRIFLFHGK